MDNKPFHNLKSETEVLDSVSKLAIKQSCDTALEDCFS